MAANLTRVRSPSKENVDPNAPTRLCLESPLHSKNGMWDSNDPMRNPPPLPLSPQMLKTSTLHSQSSSPTAVGKLPLVQIDNSEIEHQLKRLADIHMGLKGLLSSIDTSVKQTQIDLDNLVARSLNNNTHLKDLLQNVSATNKDANDLTEKRVNELLQSYISPLREKLVNVEQLKHDLSKQFETLRAVKPDHHDPLAKAISTSKSDINDKLRSLSDLQNELLQRLDTVLLSISNTNELRSEVRKNNDSIHNSFREAVSKIESFDLSGHFMKSNDLLTGIAEKIDPIKPAELSAFKSALTALTSKVTSINDSLSTLKTTIGSLNHETWLKEIENKLDELSNQKPEMGLDALAKELDSRQIRLLEELKNLKPASSSSIQPEIIARFHEALDEKFADVESISNKAKDEEISRLKTEVEREKLQLKLKEKEIEQLKRCLSEYSKKEELSQNILEIIEKKTNLEVRFESLNEAYIKRYQEFSRLSDDHQLWVSKLSSVNLEKLTTIMCNATLSSQHQQQPSEFLKFSPHPRSPVSNRVLSTNSYLRNSDKCAGKEFKELKPYDLIHIENGNTEGKEDIC